jgi:hypothetical protein
MYRGTMHQETACRRCKELPCCCDEQDGPTGTAKVTRTYWMVHFDDRSAMAFADEEQAERRASVAGIGVVALTGPHEIEYTEGDGLWRVLPRKPAD